MSDVQLERILADPRLSNEILKRLPRPGQGLEGLESNLAPNKRLRRMLEENPGLEKIVRRTGRPVLMVRNGTFELPSVDRWRGPLEAARPHLERAIRSVGRVELRDNPEYDWAGTAWIVADNIAVTNAHVARIFGRHSGGAIVFRRGPAQRLMRASVDFRRESGSDESLEIQVEEILYIAPDGDADPDIALLRLASGSAVPPPIHLSAVPHEIAQEVAVIGYPARDWDEDAGLQAQVFGSVYEVKRVAPGEVIDETGSALTFAHDCSTLGGNSGSVVLDLHTGQAIGLHYSGRSGKANYAVRASVVRAVLEEQRSRPSVIVPPPQADDEARQPRVHPAAHFEGRRGYDPAFHGDAHRVPLPRLSGAIEDDLAESQLLDYTHFSVALSRSRHLALFTAVNIDGKDLRRIVRKQDAWFLDGRLPSELQTGEEVYTANRLDRGHLVRRLDPVWGADAALADEDTFHFTNACPQHEALNQKTWLSLEDYVLQNADAHDLRVNVFTGPVLRDDDREYRGVKLPEQYWKVVTTLGENGQLVATAYLLTQKHLLTDFESSFAFGAFRTYQVAVAFVEKLTGLDFGELRERDPLPESEAPSAGRLIESPEDLLLRAPAPPPLPDWNELSREVRIAIAKKDAAREERALTAFRRRIRAGEPMPIETASAVLTLLRDHKRFQPLGEFGEVFAFESRSPLVRKLAIQGLIDAGQLDRAIVELENARVAFAGMLAAPDAENVIDEVNIRLQLRPELAEIEGLLGRSYKQRCVNAAPEGRTDARISDANKSMTYYFNAYDAAHYENLWHGVNYIAVAHYSRWNLQIGASNTPPEEVARQMLHDLDYKDSRGLLTVWDYATRGEVALALGNLELARESYEDFIAHPDINPFNSGSALRQLRQLWELPESHELVQLLAGYESGGVKPERANVEKVQLEARFKDSPYSSEEDDEQAASRARIVARLGRSERVGDGTGFLFDGALVSKKLAGRPLLLTCAHVCPEGVLAKDIRAIFFGPADDPRSTIIEWIELLWTSPSHELDASLLALKWGPWGLTLPPLAEKEVSVGDRAYIIGHPLGGARLASLKNNDVKDVADPRFYYLSASDPGYSGSPVFNDKWHLTGMHRAGVEERQQNEGTRMHRIVESMKQYFESLAQ